MPLWPNIISVYCLNNPLKYIPYWDKIKYINGPGFVRQYESKRKFFNTILNINRKNRKIKMSMTIHELKWRNVNAEIICRPLTGINYIEFNEVINEIV